MTVRSYVVVTVLWLLSLAAVGAAVSAQARPYLDLPEPKVFTGADIGFRVEGMYGEMPVGTIVIRVNNRWVEAGVGKPGFSSRGSGQ